MTCVLQDMDAVRQAFLPSLELFYQATGSKTASVFLQVYLTILYYCECQTMIQGYSNATR